MVMGRTAGSREWGDLVQDKEDKGEPNHNMVQWKGVGGACGSNFGPAMEPFLGRVRTEARKTQV